LIDVIDHAMIERLFDAEWYLARYPDIRGQDPLDHYRRHGAREGRDPNPMFSARWYLDRYADVADSGLSPLEHYVSRGAALDRDPGPLFSATWYLSSNPDVKAAGLNPLEHYLSCGTRELRDPSPVFDSAWYFARYPEAAAPGVDARFHYMTHGAGASYDPNAFFSTAWYLKSYCEVAEAGENALLHYMTIGARRGYDPSPNFGTAAYLAAHEEVSTSGENPLAHYLACCRASGAPVEDPARPVSQLALQQTKDLIREFADTEPDLAMVPDALESLRCLTIDPDRSMAVWRSLYLSLYDLPSSIVLVGSIDDAPGLATAVLEATGVLVIEMDSTVCSTAEQLPRGVEWRSLAEFDGGLDTEDRVRVAFALINHLQPAALLVWGSRVGWEVLARVGPALRLATALFATTHPAPDLPTSDLLRQYFRTCAPSLAALYGPDRAELQRIAALFGLPPGEHTKLRTWDEMEDAGGFLGLLRKS
jgi:hypothetical protein